MKENKFFFNDREGTAPALKIDEEISLQTQELEDLYENLCSKQFSSKKWISKFSNFSNKHDRILYSVLSGFIIKDSENKIMNLDLNLQTLQTAFINKHSQDDNKVIKMYFKFFDHCSLAIAQRRIYNMVGKVERKRIQGSVEKKMDEVINKKIGEYEKNITGQLISLVSIFTALSFVIFGGINALGSIIDNVKNSYICKLSFVADIWFLCMFNVMFLFVKFIVALTGKKIEKMWIYFAIINTILIIVLIVLCNIFKVHFFYI